MPEEQNLSRKTVVEETLVEEVSIHGMCGVYEPPPPGRVVDPAPFDPGRTAAARPWRCGPSRSGRWCTTSARGGCRS